jgi:hypothetical protein
MDYYKEPGKSELRRDILGESIAKVWDKAAPEEEKALDARFAPSNRCRALRVNQIPH